MYSYTTQKDKLDAVGILSIRLNNTIIWRKVYNFFIIRGMLYYILYILVNKKTWRINTRKYAGTGYIKISKCSVYIHTAEKHIMLWILSERKCFHMLLLKTQDYVSEQSEQCPSKNSAKQLQFTLVGAHQCCA